MVRLNDYLDMTIAVGWDVKQQSKSKLRSKSLCIDACSGVYDTFSNDRVI